MDFDFVRISSVLLLVSLARREFPFPLFRGSPDGSPGGAGPFSRREIEPKAQGRLQAMSSAYALRQGAQRKILTMYRRGQPLKSDPREGAMNVLIADDDPGFRSTLKKLLKAREGTGSVWEAADGEEAIRYARDLHPDVVLMDLAMPRIGGMEATRLIKATQPKICVVVCSVHNEPIYRRVATLNGADAFLPKSSFLSGLDMIDRLVHENRG